MPSNFFSITATFVLALLASPSARAADPPPLNAPKVAVELIAPVTAIRAGEPLTIGLRQVITPHWHTYWKNPGDSGEPTKLTWKLPDGFTASQINWPIPEAIPVGPLTNYGYSDEVLLPVTITPPASLAATTVTLEAKAEWLVCEKICIPEEKTVSLTLPVLGPGTALPPSAHTNQFAAAARAQPIATGWPATATRTSGGGFTLDIAAPGLDRGRIAAVRYFPDAWGVIANAAPQTVTWSPRGLSLTLQPGELAAATIGTFDGVLVLTEKLGQDELVRNGIIIQAPLVAGGSLATVAGFGLWQAALFAFLGGLILNLMPCVLPILSIKVMSIAAHDQHGQSHATQGALAFLTGVLVSFTSLAVVLLILRSTGESLGWGFQFQSPLFVLALAALFLAMALSMSGVFDVGTSIVGAGEGLANRAGLAGSFFTGVLATIAATPCTGPFMGAALGYAMTRPPSEMLAVFLALGAGFALPVVALSMWGGARRFLPKPGPWMVTLKQALAFPLYATVAWLVWVLSIQAGSDGVLAAAVVLIAVAFAAWFIGRPGPSFSLRAGVASAVCLTAGAISLPGLQASQTQLAVIAAPGANRDFETFSSERVAELRAGGRPVFVNLTAAWCISCKVNEQVALNTVGFKQALRDHNIAYLKGDWTSRDDRITTVLSTFGRAGVPLYLLFPADPKAEAIILPQLLTEAIVTSHFASLKDGAVRRP
jgi:thiol:disulfide interchange protein/DsbC/DsbD-like thiol-disulfide interchange protein